MRGLGYLRYESRDDLGTGRPAVGAAVRVRAARPAQRRRRRERAGRRGRSRGTRRETVGRERPRARGRSATGRARAVVLEGRYESYQPVNELAAVPVGVPARRLAGVAGAEIDLRWRWANLDFIPSARMEAMQDAVSRRDIVRDADRRDAGGVPAVAGAARRRSSARWSTADAEDRRQGERRALRARAVVHRALRQRDARACSATTTSCPSAGRTPTSAFWIDRAGDRLGVDQPDDRCSARWVDDLIQWQYASWGQARADNLGARAHRWASSRSCGCRSGAGAGWSGRRRILDARDAQRQHGLERQAAPVSRPLPRLPAARAGARRAARRASSWAPTPTRSCAWAPTPIPPICRIMRTRLLLGCGVTRRLAAGAAARDGQRRQPHRHAPGRRHATGRCPGGRCSSRSPTRRSAATAARARQFSTPGTVSEPR